MPKGFSALCYSLKKQCWIIYIYIYISLFMHKYAWIYAMWATEQKALNNLCLVKQNRSKGASYPYHLPKSFFPFLLIMQASCCNGKVQTETLFLAFQQFSFLGGSRYTVVKMHKDIFLFWFFWDYFLVFQYFHSRTSHFLPKHLITISFLLLVGMN